MPEISFAGNDAAHAPANALGAMQAPTTSRSMRRIQEDMIATRQTLESNGLLKPATIINFNPVPLVQDGLINLTVPAAGASDAGRVEWEYNGQVYLGHVVTVRTPLLYASTEGVAPDPDGLGDFPTLAANYILPIGIAYSFYEHYSLPTRGASFMGGVLVFAGRPPYPEPKAPGTHRRDDCCAGGDPDAAQPPDVYDPDAAAGGGGQPHL